MTKEEAGKLYTTGILLSKPGEGIDCSIKLFRELIFNAFISGVEWSEKQGITTEGYIATYLNGDIKVSAKLPDNNAINAKFGDKVIVQINKKDLTCDADSCIDIYC